MSAPAHAAAGGSKTYIWRCERAYAATRDVPERPAGLAAEQGRVLHEVLETYGREGLIPAVERLARATPITERQREGMVSAFAAYDRLREQHSAPEDFLLFEQRVEIAEGFGFAPGSPEALAAFGTADVLAWSAERGELTVADFKSGAGLVAPDTPQLMLYAAGAVRLLPDPSALRSVRLRIIALHREPAERVLSLREARAEWDRLARHLRVALDGSGVYQPGEHCTYCPAFARCVAARDHILEGLDITMLPERVSAVDSAQLAELVVRESAIRALVRAARAELVVRYRDGEPLPEGLKWVRSITRRRWSDEASVLERIARHGLLEVAAPRVPASPSRLAEIAPSLRPEFADLIVKPEGVPIVAPLSDRRKAITPGTEIELDALDALGVLFDE